MTHCDPQRRPFRFVIQRDRDGDHRWYLYNPSGTLVSSSTTGFPGELEAYQDVERVREEFAMALVSAEIAPSRGASESNVAGSVVPRRQGSAQG